MGQSWYRRLAQWVAIPHLTMWLIALQAVTFLLIEGGQTSEERLVFAPALVLSGEWWRLLTFLVLPPDSGFFFLLLAWYGFYLMGSVLEGDWGSGRYTLYWLVGWVANLAVGFVFPWGYYTNAFLLSSILFAFAILHPRFTFMVFFVIPVEARWLALFGMGGWALLAIFGEWPDRLLVAANSMGLVLYFWKNIVEGISAQHRRARFLREQARPAGVAFQRCETCGATDRSHPERRFYSQDGQGICRDCYDAQRGKP